MAGSTLGSPIEPRGFGGGGGGAITDDLPAFGAFSPAAPVLLPLSSSSGPPKWIYPLILVMVALVGGIVFMAWKVVSAKPAMLVETVQAPAPAPAEPAKAGGPTAEPGNTKPSTIAEENLPPREGSAEAKGEKSEKAEKSEKGERGHHHGKGKESGKKVASADDKKGAAAPNTEAVVPKAAKGSLDDLIDGAVTPRKGGGRPRVADDDPSARKADASLGPLSKSAVVGGMNSVKGKVADCYNQFKVQGMAMVNVVIGKSGRVSSATVSGKFAGTPTGACVQKAVKSAVFPPSEGFTTPYPFQLR